MDVPGRGTDRVTVPQHEEEQGQSSKEAAEPGRWQWTGPGSGQWAAGYTH